MNRILIALIASSFVTVAMAQTTGIPTAKKSPIPSSNDFARKPGQHAGKAPPKKAGPARPGGPAKKAPPPKKAP